MSHVQVLKALYEPEALERKCAARSPHLGVEVPVQAGTIVMMPPGSLHGPVPACSPPVARAACFDYWLRGETGGCRCQHFPSHVALMAGRLKLWLFFSLYFVHSFLTVSAVSAVDNNSSVCETRTQTAVDQQWLKPTCFGKVFFHGWELGETGRTGDVVSLYTGSSQ